MDKTVTKRAIKGTLKVIQELGMRDFSQELDGLDFPNETQYLIKKSTWIRANLSGMYRRSVGIGQKVEKGEVIGFSGNSGLSTSPHLHFEVIKNGKRVNPTNFLKNLK